MEDDLKRLKNELSKSLNEFETLVEAIEADLEANIEKVKSCWEDIEKLIEVVKSNQSVAGYIVSFIINHNCIIG